MIRKGCLLAVLFLLLLPSISMATLYTLTDPSGAGAGTVYTLNVLSLGGDNYSAVLKAYTANTATDVYLDWFQIKFDEGTAALIGTISQDPEGTWSALQGKTKTGPGTGIDLAEFGHEKFATSGWSGAMLSGAVEGASFATLATGPELDGLMKEWDFLFTLSDPLSATASFQVGYYYWNAQSGKIDRSRLSETFNVPEANTLMLIISGLVGSVVWRRKKRIV